MEFILHQSHYIASAQAWCKCQLKSITQVANGPLLAMHFCVYWEQKKKFPLCVVINKNHEIMLLNHLMHCLKWKTVFSKTLHFVMQSYIYQPPLLGHLAAISKYELNTASLGGKWERVRLVEPCPALPEAETGTDTRKNTIIMKIIYSSPTRRKSAG